MNEIEVKVRVSDVTELKRRLASLGARFKARARQLDSILDFADGRLRKGDQLLRVREIVEKGKRVTIVTFKGPQQRAARLKVREEVQFETGGKKKEVVKLFSRLGLREFLEFEKLTEFWELRGAKISLDSFPKIPEMGKFFEIEAASEKKVLGLMRLMGVDADDVEPRNYVEMVSAVRG